MLSSLAKRPGVNTSGVSKSIAIKGSVELTIKTIWINASARVNGSGNSVFDVLKQHYGMATARYLDLGRNRTRLELMCVAHILNGVIGTAGKFRLKNGSTEE